MPMIFFFQLKEFVDLLYLVKVETKDEDKHTIRYGWGVRADQEFNKYAVLKFVSKVLTSDKQIALPTPSYTLKQ